MARVGAQRNRKKKKKKKGRTNILGKKFLQEQLFLRATPFRWLHSYNHLQPQSQLFTNLNGVT